MGIFAPEPMSCSGLIWLTMLVPVTLISLWEAAAFGDAGTTDAAKVALPDAIAEGATDFCTGLMTCALDSGGPEGCGVVVTVANTGTVNSSRMGPSEGELRLKSNAAVMTLSPTPKLEFSAAMAVSRMETRRSAG